MLLASKAWDYNAGASYIYDPDKMTTCPIHTEEPKPTEEEEPTTPETTAEPTEPPEAPEIALPPQETDLFGRKKIGLI